MIHVKMGHLLHDDAVNRAGGNPFQACSIIEPP
jgi:hypothetical protein